MSRAVLYVRVSTADQVDNYSLETQEKECRRYCERQGLVVDRIFREEGESAKTVNRTQLQEMLRYLGSNAKKREITSVVVYRVDRLAREVGGHHTIKAALGTLQISFSGNAVAERGHYRSRQRDSWSKRWRIGRGIELPADPLGRHCSDVSVEMQDEPDRCV